jgi:hypothetical protein
VEPLVVAPLVVDVAQRLIFSLAKPVEPTLPDSVSTSSHPLPLPPPLTVVVSDIVLPIWTFVLAVVPVATVWLPVSEYKGCEALELTVVVPLTVATVINEPPAAMLLMQLVFDTATIEPLSPRQVLAVSDESVRAPLSVMLVADRDPLSTKLPTVRVPFNSPLPSHVSENSIPDSDWMLKIRSFARVPAFVQLRLFSSSSQAATELERPPVLLLIVSGVEVATGTGNPGKHCDTFDALPAQSALVVEATRPVSSRLPAIARPVHVGVLLPVTDEPEHEILTVQLRAVIGAVTRSASGIEAVPHCTCAPLFGAQSGSVEDEPRPVFVNAPLTLILPFTKSSPSISTAGLNREVGLTLQLTISGDEGALLSSFSKLAMTALPLLLEHALFAH